MVPNDILSCPWLDFKDRRGHLEFRSVAPTLAHIPRPLPIYQGEFTVIETPYCPPPIREFTLKVAPGRRFIPEVAGPPRRPLAWLSAD